MEADWRSDLETWLTPLVAALRNKMRGRMCPAYIAGLIGPGDRKSAQPMAAGDGEVSHDRLHRFIGCGVWDEASLEAALLAEADRQVGGEDAWLIIDDTALPKKGRHLEGCMMLDIDNKDFLYKSSRELLDLMARGSQACENIRTGLFPELLFGRNEPALAWTHQALDCAGHKLNDPPGVPQVPEFDHAR